MAYSVPVGNGIGWPDWSGVQMTVVAKVLKPIIGKLNLEVTPYNYNYDPMLLQASVGLKEGDILNSTKSET